MGKAAHIATQKQIIGYQIQAPHMSLLHKSRVCTHLNIHHSKEKKTLSLVKYQVRYEELMSQHSMR